MDSKVLKKYRPNPTRVDGIILSMDTDDTIFLISSFTV